MSIRQPKLPRRTLKGASSLEEVRSWGSEVDTSLEDIVRSIGDVRRAVNGLTVMTPSSIITPHAAQHLPGGTDPLTTGTPVSIGSANSTGAANSFSNSAHVHQGVHSIDAGGVDLYSDITFAASGTGLTVGQSGQTITYTLAGGLDAGTLDGIDSLGFLVLNAPLPLGTAWDAGNFAITLGSIVGKSGNLSITPASGGKITFSTSIASNGANTGFSFTDTVARTAGSYFEIVDNVGGALLTLNAATTLFQLVVPAGATTHTAIMQFSGTTTGLSSCHGINLALTNTGNSTGSSRLDVLQGTVAVSGTATISGSRQIRGVRTAASVTGGNFGTRANDTISGATIGVGFFNTTFTWPDVSYLVLHHNNTSPAAITRFTGLAIARPPVTPTSAVAIHAQGNVQMEAGDLLVFDGTATIVNSINSGTAATPDGRITTQTLGDTYFTYSVANTQLDCFVDAAQAFHFDAGGAAGTSRCYGALTISAGATVTAGGLTVTAGNAVVTAGNLTVTAGTATIGGLLTAQAGATVSAGNLTVTLGDIYMLGEDLGPVDGFDDTWHVLRLDGTINYAIQRVVGNVNLTVGGAVYAFAAGSLTTPATSMTLTSAMTLSTTGFTHAPGADGLFTFSLSDAMLLTSPTGHNATTRTLLDVFRNSSTGTRIMFQVRDSTATAFTVTSAAGVPRIGLYTAAAVAQAADIGNLVDSTTGGVDGILQDVGVVPSQAIINDNFADVRDKIDKIRTVLRNLGATA